MFNYKIVVTLLDSETGEPSHAVEETSCDHCVTALVDALMKEEQPFLITVAAEPAENTDILIENGPPSKKEIH